MKLFVTVGHQMPFDRLVRAVDRWAGDHPEHRVIAQIGESDLKPIHLEASQFLSPEAFAATCREADALVGHAGTGTLFAALELGKSVLVLPREAARRETRNDHQIATARRFETFPGVHVAWSDDELPTKLDQLTFARHDDTMPPVAGGPLIDRLRTFIEE